MTMRLDNYSTKENVIKINICYNISILLRFYQGKMCIIFL